MEPEVSTKNGAAGMAALGLLWGLGTPLSAYSLYTAVTKALYGEDDFTSEDLPPQARFALLVLMAVTGVVAPVLGLTVALLRRRKVIVALFAAALAVTLVGGASVGLLPVERLHWRTPPPPEPDVCRAPPGQSDGHPGC